MKHLTLAALMLLPMSTPCDKIYKQSVEHINAIDKNLDLYHCDQCDLHGLTTERALLKVYYTDKDTVKVYINGYGETFQAHEQYYLKDQTVIYTCKTLYYKEPIFITTDIQIDSIENVFGVIKNNTFIYYSLNDVVISDPEVLQQKANSRMRFLTKLKSKVSRNNIKDEEFIEW